MSKQPSSKHTPGPWAIREEPRHEYKDGDVDEGGFRIDADGIEQLAYVWRANKRWAPQGRPEIATPFGAAEAHANAHLIAAAPALYEALSALMGGDDKLQVAVGGNPLYVDAFLAKAKEALAQASGDAP